MKALSEPDPHPGDVNPDHADAEYRERRHAEFVEWAREGFQAHPNFVRHNCQGYLSNLLQLDSEPVAFADEFGWPMTLRALAQALEAR